MSDEKNNMNDIHKTEDQLADQAFSEEIRRKLAEPGSGKPTLEEFKLMVYKDREKRRKKRSAMVACIVIACLAGYFAFDQLVPEVGADKNPKEEIVTEDGVIIEDGGWGSSVGEENIWILTEWEEIKGAKIRYKSLLVPTYIPKGYELKHLSIEHITNNDIDCKYMFNDGKQKELEIRILITEGGEEMVNIKDISSEVECSKGTVFMQNDNKMATIQFDDGILINVWHELSEKEIVRLIENLES